MAPKPATNALPPKEHNLFKSVVRFYETKQLKKALKAADTILKRFPDHGETLAMKGLTLNALDKKVEATELVRKGLRLDMTSHICWHVYGLLYRSERDYREAAKAYVNALRFDKDNQQILRDLALLQIQIRDYDGLADTRRRLLTVRPNQRNNWIGFALSYHLLGNYSTAISVLDTYQHTLKQSHETEDRYEVSELLLYKNFIIEESADYHAALTHLNHNRNKFVDLHGVRETRARLLSATGDYQAASKELWALLGLNPENDMYIRGVIAAAMRDANPHKALNGSPPSSNPQQFIHPRRVSLPFGVKKLANLQKRILGPLPSIDSDADVRCALRSCDQITTTFLCTRGAQRIALEVLPSGNHPQFLPRIDLYVRSFLRTGIPSLFSDIKPLYDDPTKAEAFGALFHRFRSSLENPELAKLPPPTPLPEDAELDQIFAIESETKIEESPCTLLWVLHFLAQHYDRLGQRELALDTIDKAIQHTPTTIECYMVKARILKHCGDLRGAVDVASEGRNLDLADRYLNTKCSKYALRANMVGEAETWVGLFTRDGESGGVQALYDMQCMWFELEAAESHLRRKKLPQALKKFIAVERHFADMVEDQFDFHSYCLRKVTLRAYVSLLRFEDGIRGHEYYARAARGIVRCLLRLFDTPHNQRSVVVGEHADIEGYAEMTDAERRKAVSKRKKQLARERHTQQSLGSGKSGGASVKSFKRHGAKASGKSLSKNSSSVNDKAQEAKDSEKGQGGSSGENKSKGTPGWMEADPDGIDHVKKLFSAQDQESLILSEASKVMREMQNHLHDEIETQELSFELGLRKRRLLQSLRALKIAREINAEHPKALLLAVKLSHELSKKGVMESQSDVVRKVLEIKGNFLEGMSEIEYISYYTKRNHEFAERRVGGAMALVWLASVGASGAGSLEDACEKVCTAIKESDSEGVGKNCLSASFCRTLLLDLEEKAIDSEMRTKVANSIRSKFPRSSFV